MGGLGSGRRPQPTQLKILRGNPGKRPLNKDEPTPKLLTKMPPARPHLGEHSKREWRELGATLIALGVLTRVDLSAFEVYCCAWQLWRASYLRLEHLQRTDAEITRGDVLLETRYRQMLQKSMIEFGITPSSRSAIVGGDPVSDQAERASLCAFLDDDA